MVVGEKGTVVRGRGYAANPRYPMVTPLLVMAHDCAVQRACLGPPIGRCVTVFAPAGTHRKDECAISAHNDFDGQNGDYGN
jgi:hypothetical protein